MTIRSARWVLVLIGLTAVLALAACGGSSGGSAPPSSGASSGSSGASSAGKADTIVIKNFMFSPMSLTVAPGAMVTVHNEDSVTHTLTDKADPKLFGTGNVGPGQSKTFKAPGKAGSYPYICLIHQFMSGNLTVS
jgi:plastocyanin